MRTTTSAELYEQRGEPTHSGLAEPIAVTGIVRPPWLAAVVDEVGVLTCSLAEAIASYASL